MNGPGLANEAGYVFRERYPEREEVYRRFDHASDVARGRLKGRTDLPYGPHPRERFDLFSGPAGSPLVVFVHGGYWQSLDKKRYSFVASALVARGFSVALPNYPLAPEARLETIVDSIRRCLPAMVQALVAPPPFAIAAGHSAGAHLAAMLALSGSPAVPVAACVPVSGVFDVEPLLATSLNGALGLDRARALDVSPVRHAPPPGLRLAAIVGDAETADFVNQSRSFVASWQTAGADAELVSLAGRNHYTVLCDMLEERSRIVEVIVRVADALRGRETGIERH
jgi:arylformamidase